MPHLSLHPTLRTCSSDTILRATSELATGNTTYTSDTGKSYEFNTDTKAFGLKKTSRIKAFVFKFISVPAKLQRQKNRQIGHLTAKLACRSICCGF